MQGRLEAGCGHSSSKVEWQRSLNSVIRIALCGTGAMSTKCGGKYANLLSGTVLAHSGAVRLRALLKHRVAYVASKPPEQNQSELANESNVARCQEFS